MKHATFLLVLLGAAALIATAESPAPVKLTGWFACEKCTAPRVAKGDLRPSNPECAKQCIDKGDTAVFIDAEGKRLLKVKNHPAVKDDLGYHVEVTGRVDAVSGSIVVDHVEKLDYEGASCARKPAKKQ